MTREDAINGLRLVADFLEANPELSGRAAYSLSFQVPCFCRDELAAFARACPRTEKHPIGGNMFLYYYPMEGVKIFGAVSRDEVCTAKTIKKMLPAEPERTIAAKPEREVEEVVWDCGSILEPSANISHDPSEDERGKVLQAHPSSY